MTAEDLLKIEFIGDTQISPDGRELLFAKRHINDKNKYITNVYSVELSSGKIRQWTQGEGGAGAARYSPDGSQILFISGREKPNQQFFLMPRDGGEARKLSDLPEGSIGGYSWSPNGKYLVFSFRQTQEDRTTKGQKEREEKGLSTPPWEIETLWYRLDGDGYFGQMRYHLYLLDVETGKHTLLYDKDKMGFTSYDWMPDSSGLVICHSDNKNPILDKPNDQFWLLDLKGKTKKIKCSTKGDKGSVRVSPDGKMLAYIGCSNPEGWGVKNQNLFVLPIEGGDPVCLTEKDDYCLDVLSLSDTNIGHTSDGGGGGLVVWSKDQKSIYVSIGTQGAVHLGKVNVAKGGVELLTSGKMCFIASNTDKEQTMFAGITGSATKLNEAAVFDLKKKELKTVANHNKSFYSEIEIAPSEDFWVDSTDGVKVHCWIMMPPSGSKKKVPAILEIHGGPHAQYGWAFFHEFQMLAAQGYAVVFSNPRGSKGYGEKFCEAIKGDWGNKDWDDVQAVINWMSKQSFIDSKNMGVMGGSYGGYMTNWVVGHTHAFKAAITDRCVSNWVSMAGNSDFPMNSDGYFGGYAWGGLDKIESLWRQSPLAYFDKVKTPMLIIHSEGDLRCNVEQSDQVFHALQAQGIESRYVRYPVNTSHGLSRGGPPDLRLHRLREISNWWKKHLKSK